MFAAVILCAATNMRSAACNFTVIAGKTEGIRFCGAKLFFYGDETSSRLCGGRFGASCAAAIATGETKALSLPFRICKHFKLENRVEVSSVSV